MSLLNFLSLGLTQIITDESMFSWMDISTMNGFIRLDSRSSMAGEVFE